MTTIRDDGGQAFPSEFFETEHGDKVSAFAGSPGMSLRDWFAGQAMAGLLANQQAYPFGMSFSEPHAAMLSYRVADAMLGARK